MADSQHTGRPGVTQAKRDSYLRYVQIHMELLRDSLAGQDFGCGLEPGDRQEIERHLLEIWNITWTAKLEVVEPRPAPGAPGDAANTAPRTQGGKVLPFRPRLAG